MATKISKATKKVPVVKVTTTKTAAANAASAVTAGASLKKKNTSFKFSKWAPDTSAIKKADMPVDVIAPRPMNERFIPLAERSIDLITRRITDIKKRIKENAEKNASNKVGLKDMPTVKKIPLGKLEIVIDVQRPLDEEHVIDIIVHWDSRFFRTPKGSYDPIRGTYCITDGQHRLIAFREKIRLGHFPEIKPEDWEKVEVLVEITDLDVHDGVVDYSPCREQFLGENGGYTKKVSEMDKFLNEVSGKIVDSPNKETKPEYERAARRYQWLKDKKITCVHTKDGTNGVKSSAFTGVRYLRDQSLTDDEVQKIAKHHHDYWRHEVMSDVEILPIAKLIRLIEKNAYYNSKDKRKVTEKDTFLRNCNATVQAVAGDWENYQLLAQKVWGTMCSDVRKTDEKVPDDLSLALLLQLTKIAGSTHPSIDGTWYNKYVYNDTTLFDCLDKAKQALF